jgi:NAD(P)-dependent dehydrogenase (short-subunit alcohol dehydrogenase family)
MGSGSVTDPLPEYGKARRQGRSGDGRGIGEATVRRFLAEGASVAFCDRDGERGQRAAAGLETAGAKVAFTQADVGTEAACLAFVNGAAQKFGRLDILINNAGIRKYEKADEASAASWKEILDVNLKSFVFCAKAAVPLMRRNEGGAIVNTASVHSVVAGGGNLQYDRPINVPVYMAGQGPKARSPKRLPTAGFPSAPRSWVGSLHKMARRRTAGLALGRTESDKLSLRHPQQQALQC